MVSSIDLKIVIVRSEDGFAVMAETESSGRAGPEPLDWTALRNPEFRAMATLIRDRPLATSSEILRGTL
jgi:hypothetical protein